MEKDFEIKFGKSSSPSYLRAIGIAKKFSDFTPIGEKSTSNVIRTDRDEIYDKYKAYESLLSLISNWKSTVIIYNGLEISKNSYLNQFVSIINCAKRFNDSIVKEKYCNFTTTLEGWGCKFLTEIKRHLESDAYYSPARNYWYKFGRFKSEKIWEIDKPSIKEYLRQEVENKRVFHCPIYSLDKSYQYVDNLPDTIDLIADIGWEIQYQEDFHGTVIEKRPISIKHHSEDVESNTGFGISISLSDILPDKEKKINRNIPNVTFNDIGGIDGIIDQIREVIELPLKRPEFYKHLGVKPHKGILLYGDPGNGKTLIAKAIANEVKAHFIPISGPELLNKYYGQSEENLRNVFKEARYLQPSIIFFDEIDSIAQKRSEDENARIDAKFVNQLLTLMDGMESYENVIIIASTNRPELLDTALLRPGRFDYKIEISNPDDIGCYKILQVATRNMPLDTSFNINKIVPRIVGCSGAEIVFIAKEAALIALRRSVDLKNIIMEGERSYVNLDDIKVTQADFILALTKLKANEIS